MFSVTAEDLDGLLSAVDFGWAKEIKGASFWDEADHFIRFFHIDGRVFREDYNDGSATWLEVVGENLSIFACYHPEVTA